MKKRILSILLTLCLVAGLLPATAFATEGAAPTNATNEIEYVEMSWNGSTVTSTPKTTTSATTVNNSDNGAAWGSGVYFVGDDTVINGNITLNGNVSLIIADGATLTVNGGIIDNDDNDGRYSIDIYGQEAGTGSVVINSGADNAIYAGAISVHGVDMAVDSENYGVYADGRDGSINIYKSEINIRAKYDAVFGYSGACIYESVLDIYTNDTNGSGVMCQEGEIEIHNSTMTIEAGGNGIDIYEAGGNINIEGENSFIYILAGKPDESNAGYAVSTGGGEFTVGNGLSILLPASGRAETVKNSAKELLIEGEDAPHSWSAQFVYNSTHHWRPCEYAGCLLPSLPASAYAAYAGYGVHSDDGDDGLCDACGCSMPENRKPAVYVGGEGLTDGEYLLNNGGIIHDENNQNKPESGYAYYNDGILTLNNYKYKGAGYLFETSDFMVYYSAVEDLQIVLEGENSLLYNDDNSTSYGIYSAVGNISLSGDGTLDIVAGHGIYAESRDIEIAGGTINFKGVNGGSKGIYAGRNIIISSGSLNIESEEYGLYAERLDITGGQGYIYGERQGIHASGNLTISSAAEEGFHISCNPDSADKVVDTSEDFYAAIYASGYAKISPWLEITEPEDGTLKFYKSTVENDGRDSFYTVMSGGELANQVTIEPTESDDNIVYVGGVKMTAGDYLVSGADSVSTSAPAAGGYAYFDGSKLTLNNYEYEGTGYQYAEKENEYYSSLICAQSTGELEIVLEGSSSMDYPEPVDYNDNKSYDISGIYAEYGDLKFSGDGSLNITALDDGINVENGDVNIAGGSLNITAGDDGIYCYDVVTASGVVNIKGGKLVITAVGNGIEGIDIKITGGSVEAESLNGWPAISRVTDVYQDSSIFIDSNLAIVSPANGSVKRLSGTYDDYYDDYYVEAYYNYDIIADSNGNEASYVKIGVVSSGGGYVPPSTPPTQSVTVPSIPPTQSVTVPSIPPTQSVTVPISGDDNTIHVGASVSGDKATIKEVDLDHLDTVIGDHVDVGTVTIDFSVLDSSEPITTVEIPADVVHQIAEAVADPNNNAESLEIILSDGTSIEFDAVALGEKADQAGGEDITISILSSGRAKPNKAQEEVINGRPFYDITVTSGGKTISDMGGRITIHAPYELKPGEKAEGITVWYVDENGKRERCETVYDAVNKRVNWQTDHLSLYMIDYDENPIANCRKDNTCPLYGYTDLDMTAWYHDGVHFCIENGLMTGSSETTFAPDMTTSRAMIVTILWRLEGEPVVNYAMSFEDVAADTWYTEAVRWAASEGIVSGYSDEAFGPDDVITREQLATILYRYEQSNGGGFTDAWMIRMDYADLADVSDWAYDAMCWMNMNGIVNGKPGKVLDPKGSATRAEAATMLYRYCEVMTKVDDN